MKQFFMVTPSADVTKKTSFDSVVSTRSRAAAAGRLMACPDALSARGAFIAQKKPQLGARPKLTCANMAAGGAQTE